MDANTHKTDRRPRVAVVPCSAAKLDRPAPAGELYTGPLYRSAILAAEALELRGEIDAVVILSAKHGLVDRGTELAPYNVTFGDADAIAPWQLMAELDQLEHASILPLLPRAYADVLGRGVALVNNRRRAGWHNGYPIAEPGELLELELEPNPLDGSAGILEQRGRLRRLREAVPA